MINFIKIILSVIFHNHSAIIAENLALRHQISVLKRSIIKPKIRKKDRFFWILLSKLWSNWKKSLFIVQPETVVKWHRQGFQTGLENKIKT